MQAAKMVLERILPAKRSREINFELGELKTAADATDAMAALLQAVARGEIAPTDALDVGRLIEAFIHAHETRAMEERLASLELLAKGYHDDNDDEPRRSGGWKIPGF